MPRTITVSVRFTTWELAKAVDGLTSYEKSFQPDQISRIVKGAFLHGVNYLTQSLPLDPSQKSQDIIDSITKQPKPHGSITSVSPSRQAEIERIVRARMEKNKR